MKTVLITGASRGIGRATAHLFAAQGYNVVINYHHSHQAAHTLEQEINSAFPYPRALAVCADVSDRKEVDQMIQAAYDRFCGIQVLVNNAGVARQQLFSDTSEQDWNFLFDINVKGAFHCTQAVLPAMISARQGKIINISSIWGIAGASCEVCYSASKAALIGFTKALAKEVGPSGVQVNCVAPGIIDTDMNAAIDAETLHALTEETPLQKIGRPSDVAQAILFLASAQSDFITGQVISPNGGFLT